MADRATLTILSDQIIRIKDLKDDQNNFLNAATVTATLVDDCDNLVSGLSSGSPNTSLTLTYESGTTGNYAGNKPETFNPPPGRNYTLKIDAVEGSIKVHFENPCTVQAKGATVA